MVPEAPLENTGHGLVPTGEGWFVVNAREAEWRHADGRTAVCDFVHCPPEANHTIVGAGDGPCVVIAIGARDRSTGPGWGGYTADPVAARHGASVERDTSDASEAYAALRRRTPTAYRDGWLCG